MIARAATVGKVRAAPAAAAAAFTAAGVFTKQPSQRGGRGGVQPHTLARWRRPVTSALQLTGLANAARSAASRFALGSSTAARVLGVVARAVLATAWRWWVASSQGGRVGTADLTVGSTAASAAWQTHTAESAVGAAVVAVRRQRRGVHVAWAPPAVPATVAVAVGAAVAATSCHCWAACLAA